MTYNCNSNNIILSLIAVFCCNFQKTDDHCGVFAVILTSIVDNLSVFYQHLNGPSIIAAATDILAYSLVPVFQHSHQR